MLYPSIDKLLEKTDSKYSLVVGTAKRARRIKDGVPVLIEKPISHKFVGVALEEFITDKISMTRK